jgi:hypothetical protein
MLFINNHSFISASRNDVNLIVSLDLEYKFTSLNANKLDICSDRYFKQRSKKTPTISDEGLLFWWAHQDLNLGPKDYESRHPR